MVNWRTFGKIGILIMVVVSLWSFYGVMIEPTFFFWDYTTGFIILLFSYFFVIYPLYRYVMKMD